MRITFLGHAGFCVESDRAVVVMDPWLSANGAFDSAWFQFPRNHHMAEFVRAKLADDGRERFVYVSHEHKDHYDLDFLESLPDRDFTLVVAHFRRPELRETLGSYRCKGLVSLRDGERLHVPGGFLTLLLDDKELNRDSAALLEIDGHRFLNLNDSKVHDRLGEVVRAHGDVHAFACQFSGATYHPTCYEYSSETYRSIALKKRTSKFHQVERAIRALRPRVYLASAGPPCFLDPQLMRLNFEPVNIFPRAPQVLDHLTGRLGDLDVALPLLMPGDAYDLETGEVARGDAERVDESNVEEYIRAYAADYEGVFVRRREEAARHAPKTILERLRDALQVKLDRLSLRERIRVPLYFRLEELPGRMLRLDFRRGVIETASERPETSFYSMSTTSLEVARVLDGHLTWEDFLLAFRFSLNRAPDVYQIVLNGFLTMEPDDVEPFCAKILELESRRERVVVEAGGKRFSVDRYCPHQGGELAEGWVEGDRFLVCPRHRWSFDLQEGGRCSASDTTIHAVPLEEE